MDRVILHYDMDYYFAQVLERENPELKSVPVIVGAKPGQRGVVCTSNYLARKNFGIHSGMSSHEAFQKCPHGVFLHPPGRLIAEASRKITNIARDYSDIIEFVGSDEGYIELTNTKHLFHNGDLFKIASELQKRVFDETQLTCSVGISYCKFGAKMASKHNKPNGIYLFPDRKKFAAFIRDKDIDVIYGIGNNVKKTLNRYRIQKVYDIIEVGLNGMKRYLGVYGEWLYWMANGVDDREVSSYFVEKGLGNSRTLKEDIYGIEEVRKALVMVIKQACFRLKKKNMYCRTVTVRLRYHEGFRQITRAKTLEEPISTPAEIMKVATEILETKVKNFERIRLVGIRLSKLTEKHIKQLTFNDSCEQLLNLSKTEDLKFQLRKKFGYNICKEGIDIIMEKGRMEVDHRELDEIRGVRPPEYLERVYRGK